MKRTLLATAVLSLTALLSFSETQASGPIKRIYARNYSANVPWHGSYYSPAWNGPVALVVPPTAEKQTKWSWGVTNTEVTPIYHQFRRNYPGPYTGGGPGFAPTPAWPGHTDQFGTYYIRGPW